MAEPYPDRHAGDYPADEAGAPRYSNLGDYLRVIRRRRLLIALVALGTTALALAVTLVQEPTYRASAQVSFRDPLEDVDLFGTGSGAAPSQPPAVRAATNAELVRSPAVTKKVTKALDRPPTTANGSVTTSVGVQTNLVSITAEASDAEFATRLANEYATQATEVATALELDRMKRAEESIEDELARAREAEPPSPFRLSLLEGELSRIRTLQDVAEPATIVRTATVPGSPISPNLVRNVGLGAALGIVLGLMAAFVRDSLDRRLHSAHEIHRELGLPVLGRVRSTAMGMPGLAANGAGPMQEIDFEAFRVLRTNLAALEPGRVPRALLITSALPEEGKTTVSMSLASAAAAAGQRVLLVECDLRRPSFSRRLGVKAVPGLTDYLRGTAAPQEVLQTVALRQPHRVGAAPDAGGSAGHMVCLTAGSPIYEGAELLVGERFTSFVDKVSKAYDLVIFDSSPLLSVADPLELIQHVDGVIVCVRVMKTTREQLRAAQSALHNLPERPMGAVVTGIRPGDSEAYDYYYGY